MAVLRYWQFNKYKNNSCLRQYEPFGIRNSHTAIFFLVHVDWASSHNFFHLSSVTLSISFISLIFLSLSFSIFLSLSLPPSHTLISCQDLNVSTIKYVIDLYFIRKHWTLVSCVRFPFSSSSSINYAKWPDWRVYRFAVHMIYLTIIQQTNELLIGVCINHLLHSVLHCSMCNHILRFTFLHR